MKTEERHINYYGSDFSVFSDGSVSNNGASGKRTFGSKSDKGYMRMLVRDKSGKYHTVFIHRLVAIAYISNPHNKPQINHINGNKQDNRPCNLEWCTNKENQNHRREVLKKYGKRTPVMCVETNTRYETITDASIQTKTSRGNICGCVSNRRKTAGGFHWKGV